MSKKPLDKPIANHLTELWNGNKALATTFWGYYVLIWIIISLFGAMLAGLMAVPALILNVAWSAFMIVPIWRAASKYEGPESFAILAKIFVVLLAINVLIRVSALV